MLLSDLMAKLGSRNLVTDPSYRKVDKIGRVTIGKEFAGKEVVVIALCLSCRMIKRTILSSNAGMKYICASLVLS